MKWDLDKRQDRVWRKRAFACISSPFSFVSLYTPSSYSCLHVFHLQLSFIARIVPSPDWFVGVDSVDLCDGDHWKENASMELFPYDAGTDSGFTFSSPNFETIPQDKITQVGELEPRHSTNIPSIQTQIKQHFMVPREKGICVLLLLLMTIT